MLTLMGIRIKQQSWTMWMGSVNQRAKLEEHDGAIGESGEFNLMHVAKED